jgi:toxin ParE1/3/4
MQVQYYSRANEDIYNIWATTLEKWSEKQADDYILGIHSTAGLAAEKNKPWRQLPRECISHITENNLYFVVYKRHCIFFKDLGNSLGIGVIAVLYDGMDIPARIRDRI